MQNLMPNNMCPHYIFLYNKYTKQNWTIYCLKWTNAEFLDYTFQISSSLGMETKKQRLEKLGRISKGMHKAGNGAARSQAVR